MARTTGGTWVEYADDPNTLGRQIIVRPFSSEITALRSATENGNRAVFVEFGDTLAEALTKRAVPKVTTPKSDK